MAISNINTASNGDGTSCTLTIASGSGNNRYAMCIATQFRNTPTINSATPRINGVNGTQGLVWTDSTNYATILYYWLDANLPSSGGNYTLDLGSTPPGGVNIAIAGISCDGAAQNAPADTDSAQSTGTNPALTLTGGDLTFVGCMASAAMTINAGQTQILASTNSGSIEHAFSYDTADGTVGYSKAPGNYWIIAGSVAASSGSGLTITSVTPSSFDSGIAGIVIAGNGFGASQGSSTVTIGSQAQTVTSWSDTSITVTSARGSNSMGTNQLKVTVV